MRPKKLSSWNVRILLSCLGFEPGGLEYQWALVAKPAVRSLVVVVMAEGVQPHTGLGDRVELMHNQALIAHSSVVTFLLAILPGLAWVNIQRLDAALCQPGLHRCSNKLGTTLSLRRQAGAPCWATSVVRTPITRSADVFSATSSARPSRVSSSITVKIRKGVPSTSASSTKS